jgi:hypothetical protein
VVESEKTKKKNPKQTLHRGKCSRSTRTEKKTIIIGSFFTAGLAPPLPYSLFVSYRTIERFIKKLVCQYFFLCAIIPKQMCQNWRGPPNIQNESTITEPQKGLISFPPTSTFFSTFFFVLSRRATGDEILNNRCGAEGREGGGNGGFENVEGQSQSKYKQQMRARRSSGL